MFQNKLSLLFLMVFAIAGILFSINAEAQTLVQQQKMVRIIYFLPNDRPARPERVAALRELIKEARQFFADEMQRHGYGRKTFNAETNASGEPLIHHFDGKFEDAYYHKSTPSKVWEEITERFDVAAHVYVCVIDISIESIGTGGSVVCGDGSTVMRDRDPGQDIIIPASGRCLNERAYALVAHELGHAFGLAHDFRDDAHVMSYGARPNELSSCAAEWLDVSPFLNIDPNPANIALQFDTETTVKMLPPIEVPPNGVRIRFEINDPDGLHQAQLYIPTTDKDPVEGSGFKLHSCRSLSGEVSTLEFITTELPREDMFVRLRVMDVRGNFSWWNHYFKFQATDILPKSANRVGAGNATGAVPETLKLIFGDYQPSAPNRRLAHPFVVAVRDADNQPVAGVQVRFRVTKGGGKLSTTNPWTDSNGHAQTFLTPGGSQVNRVEASISGIPERVTFSTDSPPEVLKGIIPDPNLAAALRSALNLGPNARITKQTMRKLTELRAKNSQIADLTGLEHARQLRTLSLADNQIRDLRPLAKLTELRGISLFRNRITNLKPLAKLTQLTWLDLGGNRIRNVAPLAGLTQLDWLALWENQIKILRPLVSLTQLSRLDLRNNQISNVTPLAKLIQLRELQLHENQIRDVSPLARLVNLETLHLKNNPIQDTSPLASLTKLRNVDVEISKAPPGSAGVISDPNLAAAVRSTLGLGPNAPLTKQKLRKLRKLIANHQGIKAITGLEHARQLKSLSLTGNQIQDLRPLAGLTKLKTLSLADNRIQGTGPLLALLKENPNLKLDISIPTTEHPPIYWLTRGTVKLQRLRSVSSPVETLWESSSPVTSNRTHLAIDTVGGKLYWTEQIDGSRSEIKRINLHGDLKVQKLATVNSVLLSITVDPKRRKLYWTNSLGRIQRANLNGKRIKTLIQNRSDPENLIVDVQGRKLYWTEGLSIRRANLNGKNIQNVLTASSATGEVHGVSSITIAGRKIYWNQSEIDATKYLTDNPIGMLLGHIGARILRANLNGSGIKELVASEGIQSFDFAVDSASDALYYLRQHPIFPAPSHIIRLDLNSSEEEIAVYYEPIGGPETLALGASLDAVAAEPMSSSLAAAPQVATPDQTGLLANYPNPFNPETWIPYQLAEPAEVTLHIYAVDGRLIRTLTLGHQSAGIYHSKNRAAYWDGRNAQGEPVASGVYFYTFTAGDYTATRKMLIRK